MRLSLCLLACLVTGCNLAEPPTSAPTTPGNAPAPQTPAVAVVDDSEATAAVPILRTDATAGPRDALVTAVVFVDYECPPCSVMDAEIDARIDNTPWLRVVWKPIALRQHRGAQETGEAALGIYALAGAPPFRAFSQAALAGVLQKMGADVSPADRLRWAEQAGFTDTAALVRGLAAHTWAEQIVASRALFDRLHLEGVPAVMINGKPLDTSREGNLSASLDRALAEARTAAEERVRAGVPARDVYRVLAGENAVPPTTE